MQTLMLRLDGLVSRRRRLVLVAWTLVVLAAVPFAARQADHLSGGGFDVPGSQSVAVQHAVERDFDTAQGTTLAAVLVPRKGATPAQVRDAIAKVGAAAGPTKNVDLPAASRAKALATVDRDGVRPLIVSLHTPVSDSDAIDVAVDLRKRLGIKDADANAPVVMHLVGQGALWAGMQDLSKEDLASAEGIGFPIVLLILLAIFGSAAAALLPVTLGVVAVTVTGALIYGLSLVTGMSVFVTNMASMIGIGVAVDYSLFVLARYREEIAAGQDPDTARATALATSGVAVAFSGLTVIVSLAGLFIVDTMSVRSMALGAILVVAVSVIAATTLLPALISLAGRRAYEPGWTAGVTSRIVGLFSGLRRGDRDVPRASFWKRWTSAVMRRPILAAGGTAAILLALAVPALQMEMRNGALAQFPRGHETRVGAEAAARIAGPGASSPLDIVAARDAVPRVQAVLKADREVAGASAPVLSRDGSRVLIRAIAHHDGESAEVTSLTRRLRDTLPAGTDVGGAPGFTVDFVDRISGSLGLIALFVLALSYIVLLLLLRSVVLPLKAVVMNLLSVGAAYGVLVGVFQLGWVDGLFGFHSTGYIDALTPPLVLAIVFGLSMDYEVFLLSRIRERWVATGDPRGSVAEGLQASARTITSAALIMASVFAVFVGTGVPSIQQLGLGCAVAIIIDATLVRLILVPATMELLGRWNWWLPSRLARVLPDVAIETAPAPAAG
ncbi:MMPL family transporter [Baekduia sp.]|uniref:MMPL family transporter n=1 Tax=Baekduia sp. TaxID=2600305 RepID=UPI002E0ED226